MKPTHKYLFETVFEADTPAGKTFDVVLMRSIADPVVNCSIEWQEGPY